MKRWFIIIPLLLMMYAGVAYLYFSKPVVFEVRAEQLTPIEYLYSNYKQPECNPEILDAIAICESKRRMI